ncbi:tRNA-dihydrouridine synthase [Levilactobacillus brevis]|uniref:tRNA dihydrouridine synthase n=1 Tax=Levilactobacillus brevis TaxID=1580 RepID=UPI0005B61F32|nr:tRNA-dihydrouridine synthase [Levilactobacillus brevis]KIR08477.1 tRNA-dihydrouridine synthase [Levilactobacillus brevis]
MEGTSWQIGDVTIPNRVVVAPMAGVTNVAFRTICKAFGAGLVECEMISGQGIHYHNQRTLRMMAVNAQEHPMSIQIFGGTQETLVQAAQFVDQQTAADIIDINMGCPVNKVVNTDAGAKWLLDPQKVHDMVAAVVAAVKKPVTVKMRTGWDDQHIFAVDNALAAQRAGAAAVAMHGRTRKQMYQGQADWQILAEVAQHLTIPFMGNPWLLQRINYYLATDELLAEPTPQEKITIALEHLHKLCVAKGPVEGPRDFRNQVAYYLKGIPHTARTKVAITDATEEAVMHDLLVKFLERMTATIQHQPVRRYRN